MGQAMRRKRVLIIQRIVPHYRVPLFQQLAKMCDENSADFTLVYGQEQAGTVPKSVDLHEPWAVKIHNKYLVWFGVTFVWMSCLSQIRRADLVIIEQANSNLINYVLICLRLFSGKKVAYWGHGKNMQADNTNSFSERIKRGLVKGVDWWFCYTASTARYVQRLGFPPSQTSVLNNSVDISQFRTQLEKVESRTLRDLAVSLKLSPGPVGLYCGGIYSLKKIDFLLESAKKVRESIPGFQLIVIGEGPDQSLVEAAAGECNWIHFVGPKFGLEKACYFKLADVFLMPGLVGLAVLDTFVAQTPLFTTDLPIHSPEFDYVSNGENGFVTSFDTVEYSNAVIEYLNASMEIKMRIKAACLQSSLEYSIENMAERFHQGIQDCLMEGWS